MSGEVIARALTNLADRGGAHPPTLPQFVAASRPESGSPRYLGVPITREQLEAPKPVILNRAKFEAELDELRKKLK